MVRGHVAFFCQQNAGVWEFLTASLEEMNSKRNREFENFANFGLRVCEDLVYSTVHNYVHITLLPLKGCYPQNEVTLKRLEFEAIFYDLR